MLPPKGEEEDLSTDVPPHWMAPGYSVCMAFQANSTAWFGGVLKAHPQDHRGEKELYIAFDDGDVRAFGKAELITFVANGTFKQMESSERGLVAGKSGGLPRAREIVWYKAHRSRARAVGVLMGVCAQNSTHIAGEVIYSSFIVCADAFVELPSARTTRKRKASEVSCLNKQEQLAFHTFCEGDYVEYKSTQPDDPQVRHLA